MRAILKVEGYQDKYVISNEMEAYYEGIKDAIATGSSFFLLIFNG